MSILIEHLTHTYMPGTSFAQDALHDINLTIGDGELIGLLGHTGSGKTTFVQHLNGLLKPTSGKVIVDGIDLSDPSVKLMEVRRRVGLVFQYPEYQLFEETVAKDIAFGPKNLGLSEEETDQRVRQAMDRVGLDYDTFAERSPFDLSGGQMRRVAIAGVLAMQPSVLVLDEPTAGLDPAGRKSVLEMVRSLHASGGLTVIIVSHSMDDIATLATRLIVFSRGEMALEGTPRDVFLNESKLREIGLDVPQCAQLANRLREAGYPVPEGIFTMDEVRQAILSLKGAGRC